MKRIIILFIFLLIVINLYSQKTLENTASINYYLQKSKNQNTAGWILLGTGATMNIVGIVGFSNNSMSFDDGILKGGNAQKADTYGFIMLAGLVMDIVSIPLFIVASGNKKKAARIELGNQIIYEPNYNLMVFQKKPVPSLTLKVKF